jgi:hypothetical protein
MVSMYSSFWMLAGDLAEKKITEVKVEQKK